jgi:hypothetical protein
MALPVFMPQQMSFQQANPFLMGLGAAQDLYAKGVQNEYAQPMAQQALQQAQLNNQVLGTKAQYADPMASQALTAAGLNNQVLQNTANYAPQVSQANINNTNAQSAYYGAGAGNLNANANLTNQTTPYKVQQAQSAVYTDPILSRLYQLSLANKTGAIPSTLLRNVGMPVNSQAQNNAPMPDLNAYARTSPGASDTVSPNQILPPNAYGTPNQQVTPATAPKAYTGDSLQNWALFGSPYNPIEMQQLSSAAKTQGKTGVTQWNDAQNDAQKGADLGYQLQNFATQFQNGYKNSQYTGPVEGRLPSSGFSTALVPGNLSNEQITDNASQNAAALVAKLIAGGRVTNYEMQYMNTLKPNRSMTPQAAQMTSDFLVQRAKQMQEVPQFLNAAQAQGLDVHTAQTLWNMYRNQRPVYNFQTQQPNEQFDGTWRQFLNPQAVNAAKNGTPYISIPPGIMNNKTQFSQWYATLNPQDRVLAKQEYLQGGGS